MIRFILKRTRTSCDHPRWETLETCDIEVPLLEKMLLEGGHDQYHSDRRELVGVQVLEKIPQDPIEDVNFISQKVKAKKRLRLKQRGNERR